MENQPQEVFDLSDIDLDFEVIDTGESNSKYCAQ